MMLYFTSTIGLYICVRYCGPTNEIGILLPVQRLYTAVKKCGLVAY